MKRLHKLWDQLLQLLEFLKPMQISTHSAYTSFFLIMALFPFLLLLLGMLRYTPLGVNDLMNFLEGLLPQSLVPTVQMLVEASYAHTSGAVVSVSAIAGLWSASKGMFGLVQGLDAVYCSPEDRGYIHTRGISMLYTVLFLLVLILTLVLHVFGNAIVDFLWMTTLPGLMLVMNLVDLRFVILLLLQTGIFTLMYAWLPAKRNRLMHSFPGAVLASLGWLISSKLFSVYVDYFTDYTNIYGSIYGLALGMLWLYLCINLVFYGAAFNRYLAKK